MMLNKTGTEVVKYLNVEIQDDSTEDSEMSFTILECTSCHWRFTGECQRYGYGYTSETTEEPNFCPMCGREIDNTEEEEVE